METVIGQALPLTGSYALDVQQSRRCWSFFHEAYCVTLVHSGHGGWRYRGRQAEITPHCLMLMEPGEVHTTTAVATPGDFTALFFAPELVREILGESGKDAHFRMLGTVQPELLRGFAGAWALLRSGAEEEETREELSMALAKLFRHSSEVAVALPKAPTTRVRKAARLLRERYASAPEQTINVAEVSEDVGMSYHWLVHSFTSEFGLPPYQYVQALRLSRLRALLRRGPSAGLRGLEDIAIAVGFCDKSHLHRSVKRQYGISPWQLAQSLNPRWTAARGAHGNRP
jgi:AraC-like DNA-binding protein